MSMRQILVIGATAVIFFIVLSAAFGMAASNIVSSSRLTDQSIALTVTQLRPPECAGLALTGWLVGSDVGGNSNTLILGTAGDDNYTGKNGHDCIVGGAGNDSLNGGPGDDVLLGGAGDDSLNGGPGNDVCYGGAGINTFSGCETIL